MRSRRDQPVGRVSEDPAPGNHGSFPIVAIGASAGGLEAYKEFLKALPVDLGMAFVLVQHLEPSHHSLLADIIAKSTKMGVDEVTSGMKILPNRVYVIPPGTLMAVDDGAFVLTPRSHEPGQHLAVNFFMRSLAEELGERAIGIVLSGTGADGTVGVMDIKAQGGITFAQEPTSAKYDGMPRSAIGSACVDFVLSPRGIARELQRIHRHPYVRPRRPKAEGEPPEDFASIVAQLRKASGVDFGQYKPNTIHRRALRRMMILKLDSLGEYSDYLQQHPDEAGKLYEDVLIPVTSFFRDFDAFETLKAEVYPAIVKDKGNKGTIRMWAPGCSSGEETYSLAMTLLEFLGDKASSYQVQIFGTDLNEKGIQNAREGVYRESIAEEISAERLRRFFVKVEGGYRVNKAVRDMCVFARQNLANDPPFSQMNLVACRNLLIYLAPGLQRKIVPILHYALKNSGFLILGKSEGIAGYQNLFSTVDAKHRIFAKKATVSRLHYDFSQTHYPVGSIAGVPDKPAAPRGALAPDTGVEAEADRLVLKHHSPVGVVINAGLEVVQFRGRTTPYLEQAPGKPSLNVLRLAQQGLAIELRTLISACKKKGAPVSKEGISFAANGSERTLNISVSPLGEKNSPGSERHYLVLFGDGTARTSVRPGRAQHAKGKIKTPTPDLKRLGRELEDAQDALRSAVESEEATRQEFQAANEEILSANEELQSTNEELETSKEELQSANEELKTLNDEVRQKNDDLHQLNDDLSNFLNSTQIPVVMLDQRLRIRRLTPNADKIVKAVSSDIGRSISDLKLNLQISDLEETIKRVLQTLQPAEREVQDGQRRWWSLHVLPYRTQDDRIDGTVLALQDIHAIKVSNQQLEKSSQFLRGVIDTVREPLLVLDSDLRIMAANQSYLRTFRMSLEDTKGQFLYRLGNEEWNIPRLRAALEQVLPKEQAVKDFEVEGEFERIGHRTMLLNASILEQRKEAEQMILLAIEDITERRLAEAALIKSEKLAASGRMAATLAHEINNPLQAVMNLMTLLGTVELSPEGRQHATLAAKELDRVVHLIRQSLGFYREPTASHEVNLPDLLDSVVNLYGEQLKSRKITLERRYRVRRTMETYAGEVRQVFSTLLVNAMEASSGGSRIAIRAHDASNWKTGSRGFRILVSDNGVGIPPGSREHIFEPFFTTKGDRGTGIGLWVTRGIVQRLGGSLRVRSRTEPGKSGTCFSIFLPDRASDRT